MEIEQKARAYDKALERAKKLQETCDSTAVVGWCEYIFPELCESEDEKVRKAILELVRQSSEILDKQNQNNMIAWLEKQGEQKLPIEKKPSEMKTIGESLGFRTQKECDEYNKMVSDLIMSEGKDKPKFKVGDWVVVSTTKGDRVVQVASVEYLKDGYPSYTTTEGRWFGNGTKARLLTDKDVETITLPESKVITYKDEEKQGEQKPTDKPKFEIGDEIKNG